MKNTKQKGTRQLFTSVLLERLTRTHIAIPVILFVIYAGILCYWSIAVVHFSWGFTLLLYGTGCIFFTWTEYNVHRYLFHLKTSSPRRTKIQYTIHGVHHEYPRDKERLAMPPVLSLTIATALLIVLRLIMGDYALPMLAGFLTGYAGYLLVHYVIHAFPPPKNFFRTLWIHHSLHHHKHGNKAFGVSSRLWDIVYDTMP